MNLDLKTIDKIYFWIFAISVITLILLGYITVFPKTDMPDEVVYKRIISNFSIDYLNTNVGGEYPDTKPFFFLLIQKELNADTTNTRLLNMILVIIITDLLYSITKSKTALLYAIIPIFLNSMWLTVEILEMLFILLSFKYPKKSGWLIAFATIFRPYAALYFIFLERKQKLQFIIILSFAIIFLHLNGLFVPYITRLFRYAVNERAYDEIGMMDIAFLIIFLIIGVNNTKILMNSKLIHWQFVSLVPLYVKLYGHYFLTPGTLLFLGYLLSQKEKKDFPISQHTNVDFKQY